MYTESLFTQTLRQQFPAAGPHTSKSMLDAADGVTTLVSYLSQATAPGANPEMVVDVATLHRLLGALTETVSGLDQLLDQLAGALTEHSAERGKDTAHQLAGMLQEARRDLARPSHGLDSAYHLAGRSGTEPRPQG